ncbi:MAG: DUF1269 domain-containing protein [Mycobacterium sp.]
MDDNHQLIIIAAYRDVAVAREDFGELERRAAHGMEARAAVLVTKNADGHPEVVEAANRHGRTAVAFGAGIGLIFGLLAPPMALSVAVGAAAGGMLGSLAEHELRTGLRHEVGQALDVGTAVVVALAYPNGRAAIESSLWQADATRSLRLDRSTIKDLDAAVDEVVSTLTPAEVSAGTPDTSS